MRRVGNRVERPMTAVPSGEAWASTMAFSADLAALAGGRIFFPKGLFRYKTREKANAHQAACQAAGMAQELNAKGEPPLAD
jgi:hypothetical protein